MIRAFVSVVVRSLVELALVLVVIGALLLALAGIIGQRVVTTNPNLVERAAERVAGVLAALARGARAAKEASADPADEEFADYPPPYVKTVEGVDLRDLRRGVPTGREYDTVGHDEWPGMVV